MNFYSRHRNRQSGVIAWFEDHGQQFTMSYLFDQTVEREVFYSHSFKIVSRLAFWFLSSGFFPKQLARCAQLRLLEKRERVLLEKKVPTVTYHHHATEITRMWSYNECYYSMMTPLITEPTQFVCFGFVVVFLYVFAFDVFAGWIDPHNKLLACFEWEIVLCLRLHAMPLKFQTNAKFLQPHSRHVWCILWLFSDFKFI